MSHPCGDARARRGRGAGRERAEFVGGVHVAAEVDAQETGLAAVAPKQILVSVSVEVADRERGGGLPAGSVLPAGSGRELSGERVEARELRCVRVAQRGQDGLRLLHAQRDEEAEIERGDAREGAARRPQLVQTRLIGRGDLERRPEPGELAGRRRWVACPDRILGGLERRARPLAEVRGDLAQALHDAEGVVEVAAREVRIGQLGERGQAARRGGGQAREGVRPGIRVRAGRPALQLGQRPQAARVRRVRRQRALQQRPRVVEPARLRPQHGEREREFGILRGALPRLQQMRLRRLVVRRL